MGALKSIYRFLFTLSPLEKNRVRDPHPDPREISDFQSLDSVIAHSLRAPNLIRTQTASGTNLMKPEKMSRSFGDEALLKKLIQHRDQIPLSGRIIRP